MKKAKAPRVPVLENAFEVNLPKLKRAVKATGDSRVVLDDGVVRTRSADCDAPGGLPEGDNRGWSTLCSSSAFRVVYDPLSW